MEYKTTVILACSVKGSHRCVAGKALTEKDGFWQPEQWIRPVGATPNGEVRLDYLHRFLGREPRLGEVIDVPLENPAPRAGQPENWLLADAPWKSRNQTWDWHFMPSLADAPTDLWHDPMDDSRRVRPGFVENMAVPASLFLVRPTHLTAQIWKEMNDFEQPPKPKAFRRATVSYAGRNYELSIDDPQLQQRYYPNLPAVGQPSIAVPFRDPENTFLTVSLTPVFPAANGHHYKIAAAFFEPPAS